MFQFHINLFRFLNSNQQYSFAKHQTSEFEKKKEFCQTLKSGSNHFQIFQIFIKQNFKIYL